MRSSTQTSYRDRTLEFQSITDRLRKSVPSTSFTPHNENTSHPNHNLNQNQRANGSSSSSAAGGSRSQAAIQSEFNRRASQIGFAIHQTSQKLSKLAQLAKMTGTFNDPQQEINELTAVIKQDITALNGAVVDLQLICNSQNESGNISSDTSSHSTTVVDNLKNRLMSATKEFKEVLTVSTENYKVHGDRRRQLYSSKETTPFVRQRPLASKLAGSGNAAPPPPWANGPSSSSSAFQRKSDGESQPLLQQGQQQQQQMVPLQETYEQSRSEALQNVESTILELGTIFQQLSSMVAQQGEVVLRIDENMEETLTNVEGAQNQLVRYMNSISSNRWLMMKIFGVLIVFLMFFIFFVA